MTFLSKCDIFNIIIVVQYPSQYGFSESGPKNPPNGTSMKFLVFCFERPVRGGCWELRFRGGFQRHGYLSPFSVEACDCGGPDPLREQVATAQGKTCFAVSNSEPHKGCGMNAVGSVASLEWIWRIHAQNSFGVRPYSKGAMRAETISAKEDTEAQAVWENF